MAFASMDVRSQRIRVFNLQNIGQLLNPGADGAAQILKISNVGTSAEALAPAVQSFARHLQSLAEVDEAFVITYFYVFVLIGRLSSSNLFGTIRNAA